MTPRRTRGSKEEDRPARRGISRPPTFVSGGRSAVVAAAARRRRRGSVAAGGAPAGTETVRAAPVQPAALPCDGTGRGGGASNWLRSSRWTPAAQVEQAPPWRANLEHDSASREAGRRGGGLGGQGARGWRRRGSELLVEAARGGGGLGEEERKRGLGEEKDCGGGRRARGLGERATVGRVFTARGAGYIPHTQNDYFAHRNGRVRSKRVFTL